MKFPGQVSEHTAGDNTQRTILINGYDEITAE
jgi:hypothetical protein